MPELPEVETVRRVLESWLIGRSIQDVEVIYAPIVSNATPQQIKDKLRGQVILKVERIGKYLFIKTKQYTLVSHLRMEGKYYLGHYAQDASSQVGMAYDNNNLDKVTKHVHVIFKLDDGTILMYHDTRKFGRISIYEGNSYMQSPAIKKLGEEPFTLDKTFLYSKLQKRKVSIKAILLDQNVISGLGNIYVDETLFLAKIDPRTPAHLISEDQVEIILDKAKKVLNYAIDLGGSTIRSYHSDNQVDGKFQNQLFVYGRSGQPCLVCQTPIVKMVVAQRGTHFCPNCQRKIMDKTVSVIGITGVIGSGKSTVSNLFAQKGFIVLDADQYARDALKVGTSAYHKVIAHFPDVVVSEDKSIHRASLREQVAADKKGLQFLESVIHPYVIERTKEEIAKKQGRYLMDVPLLFESKMNLLCDAVIFVNTEEKIRRERLIKRGTMQLKHAEDLNKNTLTSQEKLQRCDFIIDNSLSIDNTQNQVNQLENYLWQK